MTPTPPFGTFPKINPFWYCSASLRRCLQWFSDFHLYPTHPIHFWLLSSWAWRVIVHKHNSASSSSCFIIMVIMIKNQAADASGMHLGWLCVRLAGGGDCIIIGHHSQPSQPLYTKYGWCAVLQYWRTCCEHEFHSSVHRGGGQLSGA